MREFNELKIANKAGLSLNCCLNNMVYVRNPLQFYSEEKIHSINMGAQWL